MGDILYVGADDSNHAGETRGEIIVATFSFNQEDWWERTFSNRRDREETSRWVGEKERDYMFTILMEDKYRHCSQNIPVALPILLQDYLSSLEVMPKGLKIGIDGRLSKEDKNFLKAEFSEFEEIVVRNWIKRGRPVCPAVVYHADGLASGLYRDSVGKALEHKKLVSFTSAPHSRDYQAGS